MSPGTTVVTRTPVSASSARRPSLKPGAANFAATYGSRWGALTFPPIEVTLTMRAAGAARRCGRAARVGCRTP